MYLVRDIPAVRYVPMAREKEGFISYRIERSEIYRILCNKIYRTSLLVYRQFLIIGALRADCKTSRGAKN